jgi:hypothetical protein
MKQAFDRLFPVQAGWQSKEDVINIGVTSYSSALGLKGEGTNRKRNGNGK